MLRVHLASDLVDARVDLDGVNVFRAGGEGDGHVAAVARAYDENVAERAGLEAPVG